MKALFIFLWFLCFSAEGQNFFLINDILYKMPDDVIAKIKTTYNIQEENVIRYYFDNDSCFASVVESIMVGSLKAEFNDPYRNFRMKTTPLFICEGKFVDIDYIYPVDIESIGVIPKNETIPKYGCKGLNPILIVKLKKGKYIQNKRVGGINLVTGNN